MCIAIVLSGAYATTALGGVVCLQCPKHEYVLTYNSSSVHQNGREVHGDCDTLAELLPMLIAVTISCACVV